MADRPRSPVRMRERNQLAMLELGARVTGAMMAENDLPAHWSADVIARRYRLAVLLAVAGSPVCDG